MGFLSSFLGSPESNIDWHCDGCEALLNDQSGFTAVSGTWTCSECGYTNDVTAENIRLNDGDRLVTEDQLRYISKIEELLDVSFYGNTLEEASNFIDYYADLYQAKLHTPYKYR